MKNPAIALVAKKERLDTPRYFIRFSFLVEPPRETTRTNLRQYSEQKEKRVLKVDRTAFRGGTSEASLVNRQRGHRNPKLVSSSIESGAQNSYSLQSHSKPFKNNSP
jgi:hypothetical protein